MSDSDYHTFIDLTPNQVAGARMAMNSLDAHRGDRAGVTMQWDGKRLLVTCPDTGQQWKFGPRWRGSTRAI